MAVAVTSLERFAGKFNGKKKIHQAPTRNLGNWGAHKLRDCICTWCLFYPWLNVLKLTTYRYVRLSLSHVTQDTPPPPQIKTASSWKPKLKRRVDRLIEMKKVKCRVERTIVVTTSHLVSSSPAYTIAWLLTRSRHSGTPARRACPQSPRRCPAPSPPPSCRAA